MILIGMFDSPFVRRVAVTLSLLEIPFEHRDWSVGKDFAAIRAYNPLGRVPTLVLDPAPGTDVAEVLIDSAAILDHLDEVAGERALLPRSGPRRRAALRWMALATGAADKGVAQLYERAFRPPEKVHAPWLERCSSQVHLSLDELDRAAKGTEEGRFLLGPVGQVDVTVACCFSFLVDAKLADPAVHRGIARLTERVEALPPMIATRRPFVPPAT